MIVGLLLSGRSSVSAWTPFISSCAIGLERLILVRPVAAVLLPSEGIEVVQRGGRVCRRSPLAAHIELSTANDRIVAVQSEAWATPGAVRRTAKICSGWSFFSVKCSKIGLRAVHHALSRGQAIFTRVTLQGGLDPEPPGQRKRPQALPPTTLEVGWQLVFRLPSWSLSGRQGPHLDCRTRSSAASTSPRSVLRL